MAISKEEQDALIEKRKLHGLAEGEDEAIPMTYEQERELLLWILDKPSELQKLWGFDHPDNIFDREKMLKSAFQI